MPPVDGQHCDSITMGCSWISDREKFEGRLNDLQRVHQERPAAGPNRRVRVASKSHWGLVAATKKGAGGSIFASTLCGILGTAVDNFTFARLDD